MGDETNADRPRGDESSTFSTEFSPDEDASVEVVNAVAAVRGVEPTELDSLYTVVDPDALDALFDRAPDCTRAAPDEVRFTYEGTTVCVFGDGWIHVTR